MHSYSEDPMTQYALDQETVLIHIDDIVVGRNIENIRTYFPEDSIKELANSIYEDGQLTPVIVWETTDPDDPDDEITELVAGARRRLAIQYILNNIDDEWTADLNGGPPGMVKATQYGGDLTGAEDLNAIENLEREDVDVIDQSAWLFRQTDGRGRPQAELAKRLHKSTAWVSQRINFHRRASDNLKLAVREGLLSFTTAHELSKNLTHEEQDDRIAKAKKFGEKLITFEEAESTKDPNKTPRPTKKRIGDMLAKAQEFSKNGEKFGHAYGVYAGLRWVLGTLADDEVEEIIKWDTTQRKAKTVAADADDEEDGDEEEDDA